jgi:hypothetical protein
MSRTSKHGKRPEFVALELFERQITVTPADVDHYVGTTGYASKYVCFLKRDGYQFETNKDGRTVVSYVYKGMTKTGVKKAATAAPKASKKAPEKKPKVAKVIAKKAAPVKKPKFSAEEKMLRELDMLPEKDFSSSSFSIDSEWDSADGLDVATLLG